VWTGCHTVCYTADTLLLQYQRTVVGAHLDRRGGTGGADSDWEVCDTLTHTHTHTQIHTHTHTRTHTHKDDCAGDGLFPLPAFQIEGCQQKTQLLHCCRTVVTLLLHRCYTVVTLLLHCCYTAITLLSHCCLIVVREKPKARKRPKHKRVLSKHHHRKDQH
jgi:hypothetical protein